MTAQSESAGVRWRREKPVGRPTHQSLWDGLIADALRGRQPDLCDVVAKVLHSKVPPWWRPGTSDVRSPSCRGTRPATINRLMFRTFGPSRLRCDELWRRRGHRMAISFGWKDGSVCCQTVKKSSRTCSKWPTSCTQRTGSLWTRSLPRRLAIETDAEDFAIWEDDVAEEQEQADEVAEEPVFAYDGPPPASRGATHTCHVQVARSSPGPRQCVCKGPCSCKGPSVDNRGSTSTCRRVHAASAHLPDDYHRARSTDGVRRLSASARRRSDLYQEEEGSVLLTA